MSDTDELIEFLRGRDVACLSCGYNLRDNASGRCPECGIGISLAALLGLDDGELQPADQLWEVGGVAFGVFQCLIPIGVMLLIFSGMLLVTDRPWSGPAMGATWCFVLAWPGGAAGGWWDRLKPWFDKQSSRMQGCCVLLAWCWLPLYTAVGVTVSATY